MRWAEFEEPEKAIKLCQKEYLYERSYEYRQPT